MSGGEIFGYGWREDHARAGDQTLTNAEKLLKAAAKYNPEMDVAAQMLANVSALAAIAQAHYAAANVRTRPIRGVELSPGLVVSSEPNGTFTTGPYRAGGCPVARYDHASPPYGPQCEWPTGHAGDCVFPA